jgi:hypothetical protein
MQWKRHVTVQYIRGKMKFYDGRKELSHAKSRHHSYHNTGTIESGICFCNSVKATQIRVPGSEFTQLSRELERMRELGLIKGKKERKAG